MDKKFNNFKYTKSNIMKQLLFTLLLISQFSFAQIFSTNQHLKRSSVSGQWLNGTVMLNDGSMIDGQVRGYIFKGNDVKSFRFREKKGAEVLTYRPDDCKQVGYEGLNIISLPKNLKKPQSKRRFYIAVYYGEHFSVLQNPKANSTSTDLTGGLSLNSGEMQNVLALKGNQLVKVNRLNFKKQFRKMLSDNKEWAQKAKDKKWFKYSNVYDVADHYNTTK